MKSIWIILLGLISCHVNINNKKNMNDSVELEYIEFKQNPAAEYFFTRKYRLTKKQLFFLEDNAFREMSIKNYKFAKKLIDSLPKDALYNKVIGHETVDVEDAPDWTMDIYLSNQDTVFMASGGLPKFMDSYKKLVWNVITGLDEIKE